MTMTQTAGQVFGQRVFSKVSTVLVGKEEVTRLALAGILAGGHVLLEDAPGTGKEPSDLPSRGIVCGAHNFDVGDYVVVCLPGAVLPGDFRIAARKTYGHVSDGMICSVSELGLGTDHSGILVLPAGTAEPGDDAKPVLGMDDTVIELNVTPDRGYAFSVRGLARELAWPVILILYVLVFATIGPDSAREAALRLAEVGVGMVDAPVSGGSVRAGTGELLLMVGGDPDAVAKAQPVLDALGTPHVVGPEPGDGQRLTGARMGAAVRCAPPANKPTTVERTTCAPWLAREIALMPEVKVLLALGGIGWGAALRVTREAGWTLPRPQPRFGHGATAKLTRPDGRPVTLLGSYHPSQQNTFTGRLTEAMLDEVLETAKRLAEA